MSRTINHCKACGHPLPDDFVPGLRLVGMQKRILEIVSKRTPAGVSARELVDLVYQDDPNGGPEAADVSVKTTICRLNKTLKEHGLRITGKRGSRSLGYILQAA